MPSFKSRKLIVLESNLDDMNPEWYGSLVDRLLKAGALDVTLSPVIMKKGRPGIVIQVLAPPGQKVKLANLLFQESTTLGIRSYRVERLELKRKQKKTRTPYGIVSVKMGYDLSGNLLNIAPEFESCKILSEKRGVPLKKIYEAALTAVHLDQHRR